MRNESNTFVNRWADLTDRIPPVDLVLSKVMFKSSGPTNVLPEPVHVANILKTPTVKENLDIIYQTASYELRINGTGFIGAKKVDFYFSPPIYKEIAYEVVTPFPLILSPYVYVTGTSGVKSLDPSLSLVWILAVGR